MLVFIDDSGDPGFKLDKGSSKHFVIACIIFDDNLDAEETALSLLTLKMTTLFNLQIWLPVQFYARHKKKSLTVRIT